LAVSRARGGAERRRFLFAARRIRDELWAKPPPIFFLPNWLRRPSTPWQCCCDRPVGEACRHALGSASRARESAQSWLPRPSGADFYFGSSVGGRLLLSLEVAA
jgi:hypothetical protein